MKTAATVQENAEDIYAEAKQINEGRMTEEEIDDAGENAQDPDAEETVTE